MLPKNRVSTHPGEILKKEFLDPMGIGVREGAEALGIHRVELSMILHGRRAMSPRMCAMVAKAFGTSVEFWTGLQADHDATRYLQSKEGKSELASIKPVVQ